jgi:hypothetical protein
MQRCGTGQHTIEKQAVTGQDLQQVLVHLTQTKQFTGSWAGLLGLARQDTAMTAMISTATLRLTVVNLS